MYVQKAFDVSHSVRIAVYGGVATSGGADTITFTLATSGFVQTQCSEYRPTDLTLTVDDSNVTAFIAPVTISTGNLTTTRNDDFIYTHAGGFQTNGSFVVHAPDIQTGMNNLSDSAASAMKFAGAPGVYTTTWDSSVNAQATLAAVAFQSPSGIVIRSPTTLPDGSLTNAYNYCLRATGGVSTYTWSITAGGLQSGLSLNTSTGCITGTPTAGPVNTITFHVTDGTNTANLTTSLKVSLTPNTPTLIQSKTYGSSGTSVTFTSNVTSGSMLTVTRGPIDAGTIAVCTDTLGTVFQIVTAAYTYAQVGGGGSFAAQTWVYTGTAPSSGADTINCDVNMQYIAEWSGVQSFGNDNILNTTGSGLVSPATSNPMTTLVPGELIYGTNASDTSGQHFLIQSPYTALGTSTTGSLNDGYKLSPTVTTNTVTFTMSGPGTFLWSLLMVGFRPSGGAPAPGAVKHAAQEY
jgi:hypothetical protein